VRGYAVPPGARLQSPGWPCAVHRFREGRARGARQPVAGGRRGMKLAGAEVGNHRPLFLIAGPCVIESAALVEETAGRLQEITTALGMPLVFKASFDKANRSSVKSFRGPGMAAGLKILEQVRGRFGLPVLTDVHEDTP